MIREAGGRRPGVSLLWVLPLGAMLGIGAAAIFGVISRSVFLDFASWWPVWLAFVGLTIIARGRYVGMLRASGLVPLLAAGAMIAFLVGHLQGWGLMPSTSGRLVGPEATDYEGASLRVDIDGRISLHDGAEFLYQVDPVRWGGDIGIPEALEAVSDGRISVELVEPGDPGLMAFAGWDIALAPGPSWDLDLSGYIDADLGGIAMSDLDLSGSGTVTLGPVDRVVAATVRGSFTLQAPQGVPVRIRGDAQVPADWEQLDDGWQSPGGGDGWVIAVEQGSEVVVAPT